MWAIVAVLFLFGCNTTKQVRKGEHLLRANMISISSPVRIPHKGELEENLGKITAQKTNYYFFDYGFANFHLGSAFKLRSYNRKYARYLKDTTNKKLKQKISLKLEQKKIEMPVIYDSSLRKKTATNIKTYLFNNGYFYATIADTVTYRNKKAFVSYKVNSGINYLINQVKYDVDDSASVNLISAKKDETFLTEGLPFTYDLLDKERTRIANILRDWGYYKLTTDNITFKLDTVHKEYIKDKDNSLNTALDFIAAKQNKRPTINVKLIIRADDERRENYKRYGIRSITVFPDLKNNRDIQDSTLIHKVFQKIDFKYHNYYVREKVIANHMVIAVGRYYSQTEYDMSVSKLNELGIFQQVRITYTEDSSHDYWLDCQVYMTPNDKLDWTTSLELSNGSNYLAGTNLSLRYMDRNIGKGANLFTTTLTGGLESFYDKTKMSKPIPIIGLLSQSIGLNTSIDLPKFLFPIKQEKISSLNAPRTVIGVGVNYVDRINYFTLTNYSTFFTYKWRETKTKMWEASPIFINKIETRVSDTFKAILDKNEILANTYTDAFIEGENIAFTFTDKEKKGGRNYNYLRLSAEEAGIVLKGLNSLSPYLASDYKQYLKFDIDAQRFFNRRHSAFAFRFQTGLGIPYGNSTTLPYIKQYFVGGAYSLRGFKIRTLGPGNSQSITASGNDVVVDRTGDIKLELNSEWRFDITKLFGGSMKLNGALFADVGNIWTANEYGTVTDGRSGKFEFNKFGGDLAADAGLGLRFDLGFFVIRFDYAMPIKKPIYTSDGTGGWVIRDLNLLGPQIRKNDWVLNFAIGYPF
jgi:outer membrane protein assembly factor BamA